MNEKVALYFRVSTKTQDVEMQLLEVRKYCERCGYKIVKEYIDVGSGASNDRKFYNEMLKDAHKHKFKKLITYRYDRVSRSLRDLIFLLETFNNLHINFISIHEACDTSTITGKLMFNIISSFAEFEREIIKQRVKSGLEKAKMKGVKLGRPRVDDSVIKRVKELNQQGYDYKYISNAVGISIPKYYQIRRIININ